MSNKSPSTQSILECLQATANETLERKRRLGKYAVVWENGNVKKILPTSQPTESTLNEDQSAYHKHRDQQT